MSSNTKIEWADNNFNPWVGCTKVSPGCDNCYAESWSKRSGMVQWGPHMPRIRTSAANWKQPVKWNDMAELLGIRYRVFCASLADVFDNEAPAQWRADLFALIARTPHLDWLLLTKRVGNANTMIELATEHLDFYGDGTAFEVKPWPNVWLGATVCNQDEADRDIPKLLKIPAAKRFLSMEPLLGSVCVFSDITGELLHTSGDAYNPGSVDWVIVGGESGHAARAMHHAWVIQLRDQCEAAFVPFLFKQWGEFVSSHQHPDINALYERSSSGGWLGADGQISLGKDANPRTGDEHVFKVGKKLAGRLLDGREWNETPDKGVA